MIIRDFQTMRGYLADRKEKMETATQKYDEVNAVVENSTKGVNKKLSYFSFLIEILIIFIPIWIFLYTFMDFDKKHWSDTKIFFVILLVMIIGGLIASIIFFVKAKKEKNEIIEEASVETAYVDLLEKDAKAASEKAANEVPYIIALSEHYDESLSLEENKANTQKYIPATLEKIKAEIGHHATDNDIVEYYNHWAALVTGEASGEDLSFNIDAKLKYLGKPEDLNSYALTQEELNNEKHKKHVETFSKVVLYVRTIIIVFIAVTLLADSYTVFTYKSYESLKLLNQDFKEMGYLLFGGIVPLELIHSLVLYSVKVTNNKERFKRNLDIIKPYFLVVLVCLLYFIWYTIAL